MASVPEPVMKEAKETFGRVAYTHKTHEKEAELKETAGRRIKVTNVAVLGFTAAAALAAPLIQSTAAAWLAVSSALVALVFAAFQLSFDPAADATRQRLAAKSYLALRNDYRRLIADVQADGLTQSALRDRRDALARELDHLERIAPPTSPRAYEAARTALRGTEELTFTDDEYRHLLGSGSDEL
jgi:Pyruvate/2-oxoacid:ferredoxin oxidoreductase gamma subunit